MGDNRALRTGEADSREPSGLRPVGEGSGRDRRPEPPAASPEEEARHEASPQHPPAPLSVSPESAGPSDRQQTDATAGFRIVPPPGHVETQGDHPAERRAADADRAPRERRRAKRRKKRPVQVIKIDSMKYPEYQRNSDNLFMGMDLERRNEDIISLCAQLWARTCRESAHDGQPNVTPPQPEVRARAA